jgi:hypothetical protein
VITSHVSDALPCPAFLSILRSLYHPTQKLIKIAHTVWAIEFATLHPSTALIGTDLSPIQPDLVPPNCSWLVDDANRPWPGEWSSKFDYVHTRAVGFGIFDWDIFLTQAHGALKPGSGWLELQEFVFPLGCDDGSDAGSAIREWGERLAEGALGVGVDLTANERHAVRLREHGGFRRVHEVRPKCPIGPWAKGVTQKELGMMALKDLYDNLPGISARLFGRLGWDEERTLDLCERAKRDLVNPKVSLPLLARVKKC